MSRARCSYTIICFTLTRQAVLFTPCYLPSPQHSSMTASSIRTEFDAEYDRLHPLPELHLTVTLRDYQRQTLRWMIEKETTPCSANLPLFAKTQYTNGQPLYFCPFDGQTRSKSLPRGRGGWVCEEMGLGKTVEVMALINANPPAWELGSRTEEGMHWTRSFGQNNWL